MSILCSFFGHKPPTSYSKFASMGGGNYMTVAGMTTDGIGRGHIRLYGSCPRCDEQYFLGYVHDHAVEKYVLDGKAGSMYKSLYKQRNELLAELKQLTQSVEWCTDIEPAQALVRRCEQYSFVVLDDKGSQVITNERFENCIE